VIHRSPITAWIICQIWYIVTIPPWTSATKISNLGLGSVKYLRALEAGVCGLVQGRQSFVPLVLPLAFGIPKTRLTTKTVASSCHSIYDSLQPRLSDRLGASTDIDPEAIVLKVNILSRVLIVLRPSLFPAYKIK